MLNKQGARAVINSRVNSGSHAPAQCTWWEKHPSCRGRRQPAPDNPFAHRTYSPEVTFPPNAQPYFRNSYNLKIPPSSRITSSALLPLGMVLGGLQALWWGSLLPLPAPGRMGCGEGGERGTGAIVHWLVLSEPGRRCRLILSQVHVFEDSQETLPILNWRSLAEGPPAVCISGGHLQ